MASSNAKTVKQYLDSLPADRRKMMSAVRKVVCAHLPPGFVEIMGYGMIACSVPLKTYPDTYNGQPLCCTALASQKNYCSLYLTGVNAGSAPRARGSLQEGRPEARHGQGLRTLQDRR